LLNSTEVCEAAGITYRQLDYWQRSDIISCEWSVVGGGSGSRRLFSDELVPVLKLVAEVQGLFNFQVKDLRRIIRAFPNGHVQLNDRLTLSWNPEDYK